MEIRMLGPNESPPWICYYQQTPLNGLLENIWNEGNVMWQS